MSKELLLKRILPCVFAALITITAAVITVKHTVKKPAPEEASKATGVPVSEEKDTEEETEEETEENTSDSDDGRSGQSENAGNNSAGGSSGKNGNGGQTAATTVTNQQPVKYIGGAVAYLDWEKAKAKAPDYFRESVFIGDSITLKLKQYDGLPGAAYMCYGSFGTTNALDGVIKANIWNSIPAGRKRVYVMLGMNDLNRVGVDGAANNMAKLCSLIEQNNPGVIIYIQSMTPITGAKNGSNGRILTNANIGLYNQKLSGVAAANGWYFVDVASVMYNDAGNLKDEYCSDPGAMGMHFTNAGCAAWCSYLMNHCMDPSWEEKETTAAPTTAAATATTTAAATTTTAKPEVTSTTVKAENPSDDTSESNEE